MSKKYWRLYSYTCIKTPIAALVIIAGLIAGLTLLLNHIRVSDYLSVTGIVQEQKDGIIITANGAFDLSNIHKQDKLTWYIEESGERYDGMVLVADTGHTVSLVELTVKPQAWDKAKREKSGLSAGSAVFIELPQGKRTIGSKLAHKEAAR